MPIGHDPANVNDPANDGSRDIPLNKFEDYPRWQNDQVLWNGELAGVFPLATDPNDQPADPDPVVTEEPATPAKPHRIRQWLDRAFTSLGEADPYGIIMYF